MGLGHPGIQRDRLATFRHGVIELPPGLQRVAEVAVRIRGVIVQRDGSSVGGDCGIELIVVEKSGAQIVVGIGPIVVDGDGAPDQVHCDTNVPRLKGDQSELMKSLGILRLHGENLPVKVLGFSQPPCLMVLQRKVESLLDRELSHAVKTSIGGVRAVSNSSLQPNMRS
jgi:hypothetical protein